MPIVIKEIVVKTTVEKSNPKGSIDNKKLLNNLKQLVLDELHTENRIREFGYGKDEGRKRR